MELHEAFESYLDQLEVMAKASTWRQAQHQCRRLLRHLGGSTPVNRLPVHDFIRHERERGMSASSINGALRVLRAALRGTTGAVEVRLLKEGRREPTALTRAEVQRLLHLAPVGTRLRVALALAAFAGLRRGEIVHLRWCDVDLYERKLTVRAYDGWCPKSHHERTIPLSKGLVDALDGQQAVSGSAYVVGWLSEDALGREVAKAFAEAGIAKDRKPGLHMLRRSFATELLGRGADIETVRVLGGWRDLATVQRYLATTDARKAAAVSLLDG